MNNLLFFWTRSDDCIKVIELLKKNNVVLGTSDTILGLLAPLTAEGFYSLNSIKGRFEKPYIILISDPDKMDLFVEEPISREVLMLIDRCWPGPLTLIMKAKRELAPHLKSQDDTIALRMPDHQGLLSVLKEVDGLFSTSANKADIEVPLSIDAVDPEIKKQVAAIILDSPERQKSQSVRPSTILDCTGETIKVIREGAYSTEELECIVGQTFEKK